jgi:beta-galactosidase/beta-glucuronidase
MRFGYPRPQLQRRDWACLNGPWRFAFDDERRYSHPWEVREWPLCIEVPFAPESMASGIHHTGFHRACWYQREVDIPLGDDRVLLHFGAVDHIARVWVNDGLATVHEAESYRAVTSAQGASEARL